MYRGNTRPGRLRHLAAAGLRRTHPPDGSALMGTRGAAGWLREHAEVGESVRVEASVRGGGGVLGNGTGVVNGGPRLLSGGSPDIEAYREGFVYPENPEFYYRFGIRRNPRTIAA